MRLSKNKGYRVEHELTLLLKREGINAVRVPLSGAVEGFKGDLLIEGETAEVKARRDGFKELYKWLEGNSYLFLKADRKPVLVVMELDTFIKLFKREDRT